MRASPRAIPFPASSRERPPLQWITPGVELAAQPAVQLAALGRISRRWAALGAPERLPGHPEVVPHTPRPPRRPRGFHRARPPPPGLPTGRRGPPGRPKAPASDCVACTGQRGLGRGKSGSRATRPACLGRFRASAGRTAAATAAPRPVWKSCKTVWAETDSAGLQPRAQVAAGPQNRLWGALRIR